MNEYTVVWTDLAGDLVTRHVRAIDPDEAVKRAAHSVDWHEEDDSLIVGVFEGHISNRVSGVTVPLWLSDHGGQCCD